MAALLLAVVMLPPSAWAQHPYRHFTDAVEMRFARSQPVISYRLRVDSADLSGFAVEMRIRHAPDTFRLAMAAHPEYDDRYWRYLKGLRVETGDGMAMAVREDSAVWRVVAPGGDLLVRYLERGEAVRVPEDLATCRARAAAELAQLSPRTRRFHNPQPYPVGLDRHVHMRKQQLIADARKIEKTS